MGTIFSPELLEGEGPKYRRVANGLIEMITTGTLDEGFKLPPVRDLAWDLKITPGTVARAYTILADEGWVRAEVGRGTFVQRKTPPPSERPVAARHHARPRREALAGEPETDFLFAPRLPDVGQVTILRDAIRATADLPEDDLLRYPHHGKQDFLRDAIYAHVPEAERAGMSPKDIVATNGGQNAIMMTLQTLLAEGAPVVLVEECSYPGLRRAVELLGAEVVSVPMDDDGVLPDALDALARKHNPSLFFTMPEAHNPTCRVTTEARRHAVVDVARRYGFHVVQDDCYRLGVAKGASYRKLLPEQAWFISSFSKTISPAIRSGYVVAPAEWASRLRRVVDVNYFGISSPSAEMLYQVLTHPQLPQVVDDMRQRNRAYIEVALNVLGRFDLGWSHDVPFFWLKLPRRWRSSHFCQVAETKGIRMRPGDDFALRGGPSPQAVRISVNGQMPLDHFRAVLEQIAELLDNPLDQLSA